MLLDKQSLFSDDQALTTTANSTNVIDLGAEHADVPNPNEKLIELLAQVTEEFVGGTSLKVGVYHDSAEDMSGEALLFESGAIALASLVAGYKFALPKLPKTGLNRYLRMTYTIVGTMSAGKLTSGFVLDEQTNA